MVESIPFETKIVKLVSGTAAKDEYLKEGLKEASKLILNHQVVAFPTETVYGLGANALSAEAVEKIFKVKNRPQDNPLIVHVSSLEMLKKLMGGEELSLLYQKVVQRCWPGPLTILIKKPKGIPDQVSAGQDTIAVRMPQHPIARALIEACGVPLAAPSANTSGRPSPTLANHVFDDLKGRLALIIDGGPCTSGIESTVLDGLRSPPAVLRPGGVTVETLQDIIGPVQVYKRDFVDSKMEQAPTTPGMKYRHYSPNCKVVLAEFEGCLDNQLQKIDCEYQKVSLDEPQFPVGVLLAHDENAQHIYPLQMNLGSSSKDIASAIFSKLRDMESKGVSTVIVQGISESEEGLAVMNRLRKAASKVI